ncbi:MFS transporter [Paenibacillus alvei]|uniref:MFS transporter n=1 Tax=Paenibacillus alvei TaxID=44250 RepID=UPI001E47A21F|nr:MFS transporter [Paenibacillus alvei]
MVTCLKNNNTTTDERARGNSLLAAAMSFGFVVGPGLGGFLAGFGTRAPLYAAAGAAIAATFFSIFRLPESLSKQQMEAARAHMANKESIFKLYAKSITSKYAI